jgi:NAD(P)-dependent dehydrogenase (short-subunit alcohol dehydrogenase family)
MLQGLAPQIGVSAGDWKALEQYAVKRMVPNPSARLGRVDDIADAVAFLASPLAGYINGTNIRIDGGTIPSIG